MSIKAIGKVTATENKPTSCNTVRFWLHKDEVIRPFDIVRIEHIPKAPGGQPSHTGLTPKLWTLSPDRF